ncbi:MAG: hypothetical protein KDD44_02815, partial [Bdellovibrionales bacterium]|nr:hypothetical protein [Bdellovibrionales bacterium]
MLRQMIFAVFSIALLLPEVSAQNVSVTFNPLPRTLMQKEFLGVMPPTGWTDTAFGVFYTQQSIGPCKDPKQCLGKFPHAVVTPNIRDRIPFRSHSGLALDPINFFIAVINLQSGDIAYSPVHQINAWNLPMTELPKPNAYDDEFISMPAMNIKMGGDIYVDAAAGNNANNGLTSATAVRDIPTGLQRLAEYFPTSAQRAGKTISVLPGTYQSTWQGGIYLPSAYQELDSEGRRMVGSPGNPVRLVSAVPGGAVVEGRDSGGCPVQRPVELGNSAHLILEGFHITWRADRKVPAGCGMGSPEKMIGFDNAYDVSIRFNHINAHRSKWGAQGIGSCGKLSFFGNQIEGLTGEHLIYIGCAPMWDSGQKIVRTPGTKFDFNIVGNVLFGGERWALQVNGNVGNVGNVNVARNIMISNGQGAVKLNGASGATVVGNEMYGVSTCVSIEGYLDSSFYNRGIGNFSNGKGDLNAFFEARQLESRYITIANNSCYIPDKNLYAQPNLYSGSLPSTMPAFTVAEGFYYDEQGNPIGEPSSD